MEITNPDEKVYELLLKNNLREKASVIKYLSLRHLLRQKESSSIRTPLTAADNRM